MKEKYIDRKRKMKGIEANKKSETERRKNDWQMKKKVRPTIKDKTKKRRGRKKTIQKERKIVRNLSFLTFRQIILITSEEFHFKEDIVSVVPVRTCLTRIRTCDVPNVRKGQLRGQDRPREEGDLQVCVSLVFGLIRVTEERIVIRCRTHDRCWSFVSDGSELDDDPIVRVLVGGGPPDGFDERDVGKCYLLGSIETLTLIIEIN